MKRRNINLKEMAHTLGRVLRYMLKNYKGSFCVVVVCTLVSALCTLSGTLFLQSLIDDYILPLTQSAAPDFGPLGWALAQMACVYALGILSSYGYNRIMVNIKLYATPGQKIAFVGSTGAGKTTITNLINRFYDIADGKIRYDGININKIKKADLRRSLGMVLQDVHLFTGTVMENIRYGRLDATDEECIAAAKLANADGFIRRLPDGYNTVLTGDGANLSQGQRQLLSIARAAVADPPVLILDEATSSIDTRTEALVQQGMDALMTGRTTFVIAHRLSTVQNSDCIMVLEQGRIIERGTHDQLIQQQGRYYQLYTGKKVG